MSVIPFPGMSGSPDDVRGRVASVTDFGCRCDGVTNDRSAFEDSIAKFQANPGSLIGLRIPVNSKGVLRIDNSSGPIQINNFTGLLQCDPGTKILGTDLTQSVIQIGKPTVLPYGAYAFDPGVSGGSNIRLRGMRIDYAGTPVTRLPNAALAVWNTDDVVLEDTSIVKSPMMGIIVGFSSNVRAFNTSIFSTLSDGLHFTNCNGVSVDGIYSRLSGQVGDDALTFQRNDWTSTAIVLNGVNTTTGALSTAAPHGLINGTLVWIASMDSTQQYQAPPNGLKSGMDYYVINATSTTFNLTYRAGGAPIIPSTGGAGVVFVGTPLVVSNHTASGINVARTLASGFSCVGAVDGASLISPYIADTYGACVRFTQDSYGVGAPSNWIVSGGNLLRGGRYNNPLATRYSTEPFCFEVLSTDSTVGINGDVVGVKMLDSSGPPAYVHYGQHNVNFVGCHLRGGAESPEGSAQLLNNSSGSVIISGCTLENACDSAILTTSAYTVQGKGNIVLNPCTNPHLLAAGNGVGTPASSNPVYNYDPLQPFRLSVGDGVDIYNSSVKKGSALTVTAINITSHTVTLSGTVTSPLNTDLLAATGLGFAVNKSLGRAIWLKSQIVQDFGFDLIDDQVVSTAKTLFFDGCNRASYDAEAYIADSSFFQVAGTPAPVGANSYGTLRQMGDTQTLGPIGCTIARRVSDNSAIKITLGGAATPGNPHELINAIGGDELRMFIQRITQSEGYGTVDLQPFGGGTKIFFGDSAGNNTVYVLFTRGSMAAVGGSDQVLGIYPTMIGANAVDFRIQGLHNGVGYPPIKMQSDGGVVRMGSDQRITGVPAMASSGFGPFLTSEIGSTLMGAGSLIIDNAGNGALYVIISGVKYRVLTSNDIGGTVAAHTHVHHYLMPATGTDSITATDV